MKELQFTKAESSVPILVTRPPGLPRAGLLLIHEAFGVTSHIEGVAARFAEQGYLVVAPALFHRMEQTVFRYDELDAAKEAIAKVDESELLADVRSSTRWLLSEPDMRGRPIGVVGFCFGGRVSFVAASQIADFAASVCFYGGGIGASGTSAPISRAHEVAAPVLAVYGEDDAMILPEEVGRVREGLEAAGIPNVVRTYSGAGHGFFCDARPSFNKQAAVEAWGLTLGFLDRTLRL